jgi:hypothetical protein
VWIFDKNDISTVTHVLMSEHAYYDEAQRAKLAPRGEAVLATPGGTTVLETQTLRAQVRIVDMQYGDGALPPNSFFDRLTVEIAVWQKEPVAQPQPVGAMSGGTEPMPALPPQRLPTQPPPQYAPPAGPMGQPPQIPRQQPPMPPQRPPQGPPPQQQPRQGPPPGQQPPQFMPPPAPPMAPPQAPPGQQPPPSPFGDTGELNY